MLWAWKRWREDKRRLKDRAKPLYAQDGIYKTLFTLGLVAVLLLSLLLMGNAMAEQTVTVVADELCGRVNPNRASYAEYIFLTEDELTLIGVKDGWAEITCAGDTVYCWAEYLDLGGAGDYIVSATGRVKVRKAPDSKDVLAYVRPGDVVTITQVVPGEDGSWGRTDSGYIKMSCLEAVEGEAE